MARKPAAPLPIVTRELPLRCPACWSEVSSVDNFGIWTLRCQSSFCQWSEKYQVKP